MSRRRQRCLAVRVLGRLLLLHCLLSLPVYAAAEPAEFVLDESVDRFYQAQVYRLPNGLQVVLKPQPGVRKVSIRLVLGLGTDHFECDQAELPHVIEHMLFEGTRQFSNSELEQRVAEHGASWNATTDLLQTSYEFEVYGPYLGFAIETLYDMVANSLMDEGAMERAIEAAGLESDNSNQVKRFWQSLEIGGSGSDWLFSDMAMFCAADIDPYTFDHAGLLEAFRRFYRAGNMSLILVGNFDEAEVREMLDSSFARLSAADFSPAENRFSWQLPQQERYESSASLDVQDTADVGIVWLTGGYRGEEYFSLRLLRHYLGTQMYTLLRNEHQLSYSPFADASIMENQGVFYLQADTRPGKEQQVLDLLRRQMDGLLADGLEPEEFDRLKYSMLISSAMEDLDNYATADYYASSLFELEDGEGFWNYERRMMALDYETFMDTLREFFAGQRGAEFIDNSAMSSKSLFVLFLLLAGVVLLWLIARLRGRRIRAR